MIKLILLAVIILAAAVSGVYTLNMIDQIVHGQLYNYGLQFSLEWANPYWTLLKIMQVLFGVIAVSTSVIAIFTFWKFVYVKKPKAKITPSQKTMITVPAAPTRTVPPPTHTVERALTISAAPSATTPHLTPVPTPTPRSVPAPAPAPTLAPPLLSSEILGLIKCSHCGKSFTQPLRMLDFQGDRPRIINICPFCNEIIPSAPLQDQKEQNKKFTFRKKNDNHTRKTLASQQTG